MRVLAYALLILLVWLAPGLLAVGPRRVRTLIAEALAISTATWVLSALLVATGLPLPWALATATVASAAGGRWLVRGRQGDAPLPVPELLTLLAALLFVHTVAVTDDGMPRGTGGWAHLEVIRAWVETGRYPAKVRALGTDMPYLGWQVVAESAWAVPSMLVRGVDPVVWLEALRRATVLWQALALAALAWRVAATPASLAFVAFVAVTHGVLLEATSLSAATLGLGCAALAMATGLGAPEPSDALPRTLASASLAGATAAAAFLCDRPAGIAAASGLVALGLVHALARDWRALRFPAFALLWGGAFVGLALAFGATKAGHTILVGERGDPTWQIWSQLSEMTPSDPRAGLNYPPRFTAWRLFRVGAVVAGPWLLGLATLGLVVLVAFERRRAFLVALWGVLIGVSAALLPELLRNYVPGHTMGFRTVAGLGLPVLVCLCVAASALLRQPELRWPEDGNLRWKSALLVAGTVIVLGLRGDAEIESRGLSRANLRFLRETQIEPGQTVLANGIDGGVIEAVTGARTLTSGPLPVGQAGKYVARTRNKLKRLARFFHKPSQTEACKLGGDWVLVSRKPWKAGYGALFPTARSAISHRFGAVGTSEDHNLLLYRVQCHAGTKPAPARAAKPDEAPKPKARESEGAAEPDDEDDRDRDDSDDERDRDDADDDGQPE